MTLPRRPKTAATERQGVNVVRQLVEAQGCIFHEIHHENDYGNDAFVELVDGEQVTGVCIAVQIKSGSSYCTPTACRIPYTEKQATYWLHHSLRVLGIVYDPDEGACYWVDLVAQTRRQPQGGTALFAKSDFRRFDSVNFAEFVMPLLLGKTFQRAEGRRRISLQRATEFARSSEAEAHSLGLRSLLYDHYRSAEAWRSFHELLLERPTGQLDPFIAYALAHIPWHGDIAGPAIPQPLRGKVALEMSAWGRRELLALLHLLDESEAGIERGTVGQSIYAIIDLSIGDSQQKLADVVFDNGITPSLRDAALFLLCFVAQDAVAPTLERALADPALAKRAEQMIAHLKAFGFFAVG